MQSPINSTNSTGSSAAPRQQTYAGDQLGGVGDQQQRSSTFARLRTVLCSPLYTAYTADDGVTLTATANSCSNPSSIASGVSSGTHLPEYRRRPKATSMSVGSRGNSERGGRSEASSRTPQHYRYQDGRQWTGRGRVRLPQ